MNYSRILAILTAIAAVGLFNYVSQFKLWFYIPGLVMKMLFPTQTYREKVWEFKPSSSSINHNEETAARPNIILILADDLGVNDVSGGSGVATPHIDSIFQNGINFVNGYSGHATCAPSRATILTGKLFTRFGYEFTPVPPGLSYMLSSKVNSETGLKGIFHGNKINQVPSMNDMIVPLEERFISQNLKQFDYKTAYVGKWHLGAATGSFPQDRGFDQVLSFHEGAAQYFTSKTGPATEFVSADSGKNDGTDKFLQINAPFYVADETNYRIEPPEYMTDFLAKEASKAIVASHESSAAGNANPLFMVVAFNAPHNPYQALKSDYDDPEVSKIPTHKERVYAAMIKALDRGIGKIIDTLKQTGQYDNTLLIFTSDNGGATYSGMHNINAPYRGGKGSFFEGGVRVPFFMQWPEKINQFYQNKLSNKFVKPVGHIDLGATISAAAQLPKSYYKSYGDHKRELENNHNIKVSFTVDNNVNYTQTSIIQTSSDVNSANHYTDGVDLISYIQSFVSNNKQQFSNHNKNRQFFWRSGHYKSMRKGDWKLQLSDHPNKIWFYNLINDPTEQFNLAFNVNPNEISLIQLYKQFKKPKVMESNTEDFYHKNIVNRSKPEVSSLKPTIRKLVMSLIQKINIFFFSGISGSSMITEFKSQPSSFQNGFTWDGNNNFIESNYTTAENTIDNSNSNSKESFETLETNAIKQCNEVVYKALSSKPISENLDREYNKVIQNLFVTSKQSKTSISSQLCTNIHSLLTFEFEETYQPLWPALSESPQIVVNPQPSSLLSQEGKDFLSKEFVYWPN
eukprot:gene11868-15885_t